MSLRISNLSFLDSKKINLRGRTSNEAAVLTLDGTSDESFDVDTEIDVGDSGTRMVVEFEAESIDESDPADVNEGTGTAVPGIAGGVNEGTADNKDTVA